MSNIKKFRIKSFKKDTAILALEKISLKFGRKIILDNLSLKLNSGQVLGLLGPNGAGKTTIFNLICGLLTPDFGSIIIDSELVNKYPIYQRTLKFKIGFVPQYGGYFHDLTVYENLKAIAEITINNISFRNEKIDSLLSKFELDPIRDVKADFLSGGQRKRLTIAIALISEPKILLLDEPFAALDIMSISNLQQIIVKLQTTTNITIIIVDHQARDLLSCVDVAIVLSNAKIISKGTPTEITNDQIAKSHYFGEKFKIN